MDQDAGMKAIDFEQLETLSHTHHAMMKEAGWADPKLSDQHYLAFIISEIGEAIHADQQGAGPADPLTISKVEQYETNPGLYRYSFEVHIKNTVSDEISDILLRILNLMELRGIKPTPSTSLQKSFSQMIRMKTFPCAAFDLIEILSWRKESLDRRLRMATIFLFEWAAHLQFDLLTHAFAKLKYNRYREDWQNNLKSYN